jgi:hypothetical protein
VRRSNEAGRPVPGLERVLERRDNDVLGDNVEVIE